MWLWFPVLIARVCLLCVRPSADRFCVLLQTFRRLLLNKCQDEFENRSKATEGVFTLCVLELFRCISSVLVFSLFDPFCAERIVRVESVHLSETELCCRLFQPSRGGIHSLQMKGSSSSLPSTRCLATSSSLVRNAKRDDFFIWLVIQSCSI